MITNRELAKAVNVGLVLFHRPKNDFVVNESIHCLLYTSDAADERSSVDLGGRRIIKKKKREDTTQTRNHTNNQTHNLNSTQ